jgi:hypothetical protein
MTNFGPEKTITDTFSRLLQTLKVEKEILVSLIFALLLTSLTVYIFIRDPSPGKLPSGQNSIQVESEVAVTDGLNSTTALKESEIDWRKTLKPDDPNQAVTGSVIEKIDATKQVYVAGSMQLPEGWTAEWSLSPPNTAEDQIVWTSTEPADGAEVTFIRFNMGNRDSLRHRAVLYSKASKLEAKIDRTAINRQGL